MLNNIEDRLDVAVIGMAGRFPGAPSVAALWKNLTLGVDLIRQFSDEELVSRGVEVANLKDPSFVKAASVLTDTDRFAATFFGYSPREAELMDPQHRIFLECAWEALEDAGYAPRHAKGRIGVYASASLSTYLLFNLATNADIHPHDEIFQVMLGTDKDFLATRAAYKLNLTGPCMTVQTGCSSSLVAISLAVQSLLTYQCDAALAGGVSIGVPQRTGYFHQPGGISSPDGTCRPFSDRAAGTVFGEGVGIVMLKRMEDALADRDHIYAVVRSVATNNDGSQKIGFTAPGVDGQVDVVRRALALAGLASTAIGYIEAHGTATTLGDLVEASALKQAFGTLERRAFCALGSIKSNLGHLDAAAGVAGFMKTVLMLHHRKLVPSLHFDAPNAQIDFDSGPFYVNTKLRHWKSISTPRRAGVSSFGIGGTNAHAVLEEAPIFVEPSETPRWCVLNLSADSPLSLERAKANLNEFLEKKSSVNFGDVAFTLNTGREQFKHRLAVVADSLGGAVQALTAPEGSEVFLGQVGAGAGAGIALLFPGGGTQYPGMAAELYLSYRRFREAADRCFAILRTKLSLDLKSFLFTDGDETGSAASRLARPSLGLPAIFVTEYAMVQQLISWDLLPTCMVGHSLGEYTAACIAGVFSLEDALALVSLRGRLFETLPRGAMLSVYLSENELRNIAPPGVFVAAINGPETLVLSGSQESIERCGLILEQNGVEHRRLHIDAAAHSPAVEPIMEELRSLLKRTDMHPPSIPFLSNLTGSWITDDEASDPDYWVQHLRHTVRFADNVRHLGKRGFSVAFEVGPGNSLSSLMRTQLPGRLSAIVPTMNHPQKRAPEAQTLQRALARAWVAGADINWDSCHAGRNCRRISLPTYSFERERYWIDPSAKVRGKDQNNIGPKAIGDWFYSPSWKRSPFGRLDAGLASKNSLWIVVGQSKEDCKSLVTRLKSQGFRAVSVHSGEIFSRSDKDTFSVNLADEEDYKSLFKNLGGDERNGISLVYLPSMLRNGSRAGSLVPAAGLPREFVQFLALIKAIGELATPVDILIATRGAQQMSGGDTTERGASLLAAFCSVIPHEFRDVRCRLVDFSLGPSDPGLLEREVDCLLAEFPFGANDQLAVYRGSQRWTRDFRPIHLGNQEATRVIREGGVYLFVGGLGQIGLALAKAFCALGRCKFAFTLHSGFPERESWKQHEFGPLAKKIAALRELEDSGCEILVLNADISDELATRRAVDQVVSRFGRISGVFHLAGITGEGALRLISELDVTECERQLRPKVEGSEILQRVLERNAPDFCVLFSSTASFLGGAGMLSYTAANSFLDFIAAERDPSSTDRWISINWDGWLIGEQAQLFGGGQTSLDHHALHEAQGVEALLRILQSGIRGQVIVSKADLTSRIAAADQAMEFHKSSAEPMRLRVSASRNAEFVPPRTALERQIAEVWADVLGLERIGLYDNFFDLGGNSLIGLRIVARLRKKLGFEVRVTSLFEGACVHRFAELLKSAEEPLRFSGHQSSQERGELRRQVRAARNA